MRWLVGIGLFLAAWGAAAQALTDDQIRILIIEESVAAYPGRCPCPWNLAKNGTKCGGRSAWSRPAGAKPICYPDEVTPEMISDFRRRDG